MKRIEEVYEGLGRYKCGDVEFILCHAPEDNKDLPQRYINGEMSKDEPSIKNFRVPAIRIGEIPYIDGLYKLEQAICRYENNKVIIESLESVYAEEFWALFNVTEKRIFVPCKTFGVSDVLSDPKDLKRVNDNVYITSWLWIYPIQQSQLPVKDSSRAKEV